MFGQEVPSSDYDLRFHCLGFPVRVTPWFWITSAFLVWTDHLDYTLVGIAAVFISILVHELGHALAGRYYGGRSEIVLTFMGGYATRTVNPSRLGNILISAAGPAAGLLLWSVFEGTIHFFPQLLRNVSDHGRVFVIWMISINWAWSLFNLLPVYPLDGGQIAHQVIGRFRAYDAWELTLKLSILVCVGVVAWNAMAVSQDGDGDRFMMIMFAMLAFQNFQYLQASGRGRW